MSSGSGLRRGSIRAARRPSPQAVSVHTGDGPRPPGSHTKSIRDTERRMIDHQPGEIPALDADFLLSFSCGMIQNRCHADPPGTSLALPNRLTGDQLYRALQTRRRTLRALSAPARTPRYAASRHEWRLVGYRDSRLARRPRPSPSPPAWLCAARGDRHDAQASLSRDRAPQPRSDLQRTALAQPCRALSALPHDPRRARTSSASLVERLSPARARRPLFWPLQLEGGPSANTRCRADKAAAEGRMPAAFRFKFSGGTHDRNSSNLQDDRHGTSPAGR